MKSPYWHLTRLWRCRTVSLPTDLVSSWTMTGRILYVVDLNPSLTDPGGTETRRERIFILHEEVSKWLTQCTRDFIYWIPSDGKSQRINTTFHLVRVFSKVGRTRRKNGKPSVRGFPNFWRQRVTDRHSLFGRNTLNNIEWSESVYTLVTYHLALSSGPTSPVSIYLKTKTTNHATTWNEKRWVTLRREP